MKNLSQLKKELLEKPSIENIEKILKVLKNEKSVMISNWKINSLGGMSYNNSLFDKLNIINNSIGSVRKSSGILTMNDIGQTCLFFNLFEGKNGNGNFIEDDMTNVYNILSEINKNNIHVSIKEIFSDSLDDLSTWAIIAWL